MRGLIDGRNVHFIAISLIAGMALAACGSAESSDSPGGGSSAAASETPAAAPAATASGPIVKKVGDGDTEHVGAKDGVKVDTLTWFVRKAALKSALGPNISVTKPDGVYVVVTAKVTNGKTDSVTITPEIATLSIDGKNYKVDN